jgi:hypothetical protein
MHSEIEDFYKGTYQKPVSGSKKFIERLREKLGDKARVDEEKPESRQVFGLEIQEIVGARVREYGTGNVMAKFNSTWKSLTSQRTRWYKRAPIVDATI